MTDPATGRRRTQLEQSIIECAPGASSGRATGEAEGGPVRCSRATVTWTWPATATGSSPSPARISHPARSTSSTTRGLSRCASFLSGSTTRSRRRGRRPARRERAVVRRLADQEEQAGHHPPNVPDRRRPQQRASIGDPLRRLHSDGSGPRALPHLRRGHLRARRGGRHARRWLRATAVTGIVHPASGTHGPLPGEHRYRVDARGGGVSAPRARRRRLTTPTGPPPIRAPSEQ